MKCLLVLFDCFAIEALAFSYCCFFVQCWLLGYMIVDFSWLRDSMLEDKVVDPADYQVSNDEVQSVVSSGLLKH
jgi:hypothetical protein